MLALFHVIRVSDGAHEVAAQAWVCEKTLRDLEGDLDGYLLQRDPALAAAFAASLRQVDNDFLQLRVAGGGKSRSGRARGPIDRRQEPLAAAGAGHDGRGGSGGVRSPRPTSPRAVRGWTRERALFAQFDVREEALGAQRHHDVFADEGGAAALGGRLVGPCWSWPSATWCGASSINWKTTTGWRCASARDQHQALERSDADLEKQKEWFRVTLTSIGDGVIVADPEGRVVFMNHEAERLTGWNTFDALLQPLGPRFPAFSTRRRASRCRCRSPRVLREGGASAFSQPGAADFQDRGGMPGGANGRADPGCPGAGAGCRGRAAPQRAGGAQGAAGAARTFRRAGGESAGADPWRWKSRSRELRLFSLDRPRTISVRPCARCRASPRALLEDYGEKLEEAGRNYLDRIQKAAAARLDRLIQDLLAYTRISGPSEAMAEIDLDRLVRGMIEDYPNLQPPQAQVEIEGRLPPVVAQEALLVQVLSNLLGNGAKFVPAGTIAQLRIRAEAYGNKVRICGLRQRQRHRGEGLGPDL